MMKGAVLRHDQINERLIIVHVKVGVINDAIETNHPQSSDSKSASSKTGGRNLRPAGCIRAAGTFLLSPYFSRYNIDMIG